MSNVKKFRIKTFKKKAILVLDKISIKFGKKIILDNLNFSLNHGQILGLLGPNGVGKSTIFNLITGLISPDFGSIIINEETVNNYPIYQRTSKFKIGFVPQQGGYFHDLTVLENLQAIGEICIQNINNRNEKINMLLSKFELDHIRDVKLDFLSVGQKKKLTIALSLISDPSILLLDEPFAALDVLTIKTLQKIIVNLQIKDNISVILCDHQARDLLACVDDAIIIHNGKVIAQGTPQYLLKNINARDVYFGDSFKIG